jgi:hypothetical protein
MVAELAKEAWFVQVRTKESPPALLDFAVGKASVQEAIAGILHWPELAAGDEVTLTSQLTQTEISSYKLKSDEVRTYGRRLYNAVANRWIMEVSAR